MLKHVKLATNGLPAGCHVIVDGHDISHGVRALTLTTDSHTPPSLEVVIVAGETMFEGQARVYVDPRSAEILEQLGWTPPAEPTTAQIVRCCDMHNRHCEPPSELCCHECTEVDHPRHPEGIACTWLVP